MVIYHIKQNKRLSNHFQLVNYMYVNTVPRDTLDTPGCLMYIYKVIYFVLYVNYH